MLREALQGQLLESSDLRVPALATTDLSGRTVTDVIPRGKHILIRLSEAPDAAQLRSGAEPLTLHSHLMMDGTWRVFERTGTEPRGGQRESVTRVASGPATSSAGRKTRGRQSYRRYGSVRSRAETRTPLSADVSVGQGSHTIRAILRTTGVKAIGFDVKDVRLAPTRLEDREFVGHLGPDILGPDWNLAEAVRRLRAQPDRAIGAALLDQRNLAGIGNVYRVEVLFMTRTHPWAPVGSLTHAKLTEIVELAHKLLNLNRDRPLRSTVGHPATGRPLFWTYGHYDQPCRRCGTPLARAEIDDALASVTEAPSSSAVQHLRTIAWCPRCQSGDNAG